MRRRLTLTPPLRMLPLQKPRRRKPALRRSRLNILQVKHLRLGLSPLNRQVQLPIHPCPLPLAPFQPIQQRPPVNPRQLSSHQPVMPRTKRINNAAGNLLRNLRRRHHIPIFIRENGKIENHQPLKSSPAQTQLHFSFFIRYLSNSCFYFKN